MRSTLLYPGNEKLGKKVWSWSLPNGTCKFCPGMSEVCKRVCYVSRYTRRYHIDYAPNYEATRVSDFIGLMAKECVERGLIRIHVSGDFYCPDYVHKWIRIVKSCPGTTFYAYSRSWRVPRIKEALLELKSLPNMRLLWSCDKDTGMAPDGECVWLAEDDSDDPPAPVKIVFRNKRSSFKYKQGGSWVCPHENGTPGPSQVTCGKCQLCIK